MRVIKLIVNVIPMVLLVSASFAFQSLKNDRFEWFWQWGNDVRELFE